MAIRVPEWIQIGKYIDAVDQAKSWCVAQVLQIEEQSQSILVNYDGWSANYDQWLPLSSPKLAPFRTKSPPYTGQKKFALRNWIFIDNEVEEFTIRVRSLIDADLQFNTAYDITQFIRGEFIITIDNLLQKEDYEDINQARLVLNCLKAAVELIVHFIKICPKLFPFYYQQQQDITLIMHDNNCALAASFPELFVTLNRMFYMDTRCGKFYAEDQKWYDVSQGVSLIDDDYQPSEVTRIRMNKYSQTLTFMINYFAKLNGFDHILSLFDQQLLDQRVPLEFVNQLPVYPLYNFIRRKYKLDFYDNFNNGVLQRIENIDQDELKRIKIDQVKTVFSRLKANMNDLQSLKYVEITYLNLQLKLIQSALLEKRIKGISEIKAVIEDQKQENQQGRQLQDNELCEWITSSNLLEDILVLRPHVEIIKRLEPLLKFLAQQNMLEPQVIDLIWNSIEEKHDSIVKTTLDLLKSLAYDGPKDLIDYIFSKLQLIPFQNYTEHFIQLLKLFTLGALSNPANLQNNSYGLNLLLGALKDVYYTENTSLIIENCKEIHIELAKQPSLFNQYVEDYSNNICKGFQVPHHLILLANLLDTNKEQAKDVIISLNDSKDLVKVVVDNLLGYIEKYQKKVQNSTQIIQKVPHSQQIQSRLDFLDYLFHHSEQAISIDMSQFDSLWNSFISFPCLEQDTNVFLHWIHYGKLNQTVPFDPDMINEIFETYLSDGNKLPYSKLDSQAFDTFKYYFITTNYFNNIIKLKGLTIIQWNADNLQGFNSLFNIVQYIPDDNTAQKAIELIGSVYRLIKQEDEDFVHQVVNQLIDIVLTTIQEKRQNEIIVIRMLEVIKQFIPKQESDGQLDSKQNFLVQYQGMNSSQPQKLPVCKFGSMGYLRRKLAQVFQVQTGQILLRIGNDQYGPAQDCLLIKDILPKQVLVIIKEQKQSCIEFKNILSQHPLLLDQLLEMLNMDSNEIQLQVQNLLSAIPIQPQFKEQFKNLAQPLDSLLNVQNLHRLLYGVNIVQELSKSEQWLQMFNLNGGVEFIYELYFIKLQNADQNISYNQIQIKLLGLIQRFNEKGLSRVKVSLQMIERVFQSIKELRHEKFSRLQLRNIVKTLYIIFDSLDYKTEDQVVNMIQNINNLQNWIRKLFIDNTCSGYSTYIARFIKRYNFFVNALIRTLYQLLQTALESKSDSTSYWKLFAFCISKVEQVPDYLTDLPNNLIYQIQICQAEKSVLDVNKVLSGLMKLLRESLKSIRTQLDANLMATLILHQSLFEIPDNTRQQQIPPPKCKNYMTRRQTFKLLLVLMSNEELKNLVIQYLTVHFEDPYWRTNRLQDWNNSPQQMEKSETGFVGIKNLGSTCYMNSIMQQLFQIESFKNGIFSSSVSPYEVTSESILYQLQYIFSALKFSDKQYINCKSFCNAYKDWDGNSVNVKEQMDVEEFFNNFMDKLEQGFKDNGSQNIIKEHFGGQWVIELIGKKNCNHHSQRFEPFLTLPVEVKGKKTLLNGLESFVVGEMLEGENAYQCSFCDAKVSALKRTCIKHLPNYLIISLRRFEFDFDTMQRIKINDYCEFPTDLNMEPFTQEGLTKNEGNLQQFEVQKPDDYYQFSLRGIVIHVGTAEFGHYYSFIKDQQNWYEFNDTIVRQVSYEQVKYEAFGGQRKDRQSRMGNAYLLIYERNAKYQVFQGEDSQLESLNLNYPPGDENWQLQMVKEENDRYWRGRNYYCPEYLQFMAQLNYAQDLNLSKFGLKFFLTIMIRSRDKYQLGITAQIMKKLVENSEELGIWLLEVLTHDRVIIELLFECPQLEKRKIILSLAKSAVKVVEVTEIKRFLTQACNYLNFATRKYYKNFAQYFELLYILQKALKKVRQMDQMLASKVLCIIFKQGEVAQNPIQAINNDISLGYDNFDKSNTDLENVFSERTGYSVQYAISIIRIQQQFSENEIMLLLNQQYIEEMIQFTDSKYSAYQIAKLYLKLTYNNFEGLILFTQSLGKIISNKKYEYLKNYIRELAYFIYPETENRENNLLRLENGMQNLYQSLEANKNYFKEGVYILEQIQKMSAKLQKVKEWVLQNAQLFQWIPDWIFNNIITENKQADERATNKVNNLINKFNAFIEGKLQHYDYDPDDQLTTLQPDQKLDILQVLHRTNNRKVVEQAKVVLELDGYMLLEYEAVESKCYKWADRHSDDIAPLDKGKYCIGTI